LTPAVEHGFSEKVFTSRKLSRLNGRDKIIHDLLNS
jgi:hypothetical protein